MATSRSIPLLDLVGAGAIELESDYSRSFTLRELDADGADAGARDFRPFDTANLNATLGGGSGAGASENGGGYTCEIRDEPGGTLLATGVVTQNGVRAIQKLTHAVSASATHSITIIYPDLSDESAAPTIVSRLYEYRTTQALMTIPGDMLRIPGQPELELETLVQAINGTLDYGDQHAFPGTLGCPELVAAINPAAATEMILEARDGGVWANVILCEDSGNTFDWEGATASEPMTGGTGQRGITVTFSHDDLVNALVVAGLARAVHYDIMGIKADTDPVKIQSGRATLYASCTETA